MHAYMAGSIIDECDLQSPHTSRWCIIGSTAEGCDLSQRPWAGGLVAGTPVRPPTSDVRGLRPSGWAFNGDSFQLTCKPGSVAATGSQSSEIVQCMQGVFGAPALQCGGMCSEPSSSSDLLFTGSGLVPGSVRKVSCQPGYNPPVGTPDSQIIMCADGSFSPVTLLCYSKLDFHSEFIIRRTSLGSL
jgi:hypothetical protein